ncbi:LytTR family transcriptional regulator DNA-binding domain-containing protein [Oceanobacillus bengalensis]|uniref:ATP-binding cassette domain-containing protein n=1 Tax=Oceanobacillus bengalensis TaxID=1435466 RepID=A0A494Z2S4_9BACI|nr:LytTR family transcriptional regulator DNA-binding domain-containing protein [Oceanobacillus bengalensis]RKQ16809.1 ATP-binding cassette domain-containing protein [Oceanobacillus bengalensis]
MTFFKVENLEKHDKDSILFPTFNLEMAEKEIVAIYSTLNVRHTILGMITGEIPISSGNIMISGSSLRKDRMTYFREIGICFFEEGLYERLTIKDYLRFFGDLYNFKQTFDQIFQLVQLHTKKNVKIKHLSGSEKRRVQFARLLIQNPKLYILEEADLHVDMETKRVLINMIHHIKEGGKSVLILTGSMESAITLADQVFRLDEDGLRKIETETEEVTGKAEEVAQIEKESEIIPIGFNKIPTKVNDKIVLFDPPEIDYIESYDGGSKIYIRGDIFPSTLTLNHLEEKLRAYGFFRCHRSYIVNLQKVREVITWTRNSYSLVLDDKKKTSIPLSKSKMVLLKELLGLK